MHSENLFGCAFLSSCRGQSFATALPFLTNKSLPFCDVICSVSAPQKPKTPQEHLVFERTRQGSSCAGNGVVGVISAALDCTAVGV